MSETMSQSAPNEWTGRAFAEEWISRDQLHDFLDLPRRIATAVVGQETAPRRVADVGSGPGAFLARFLAAFDECRGVWSDVSEAMREAAGVRLAAFGDRVDYLTLPMEDLSALPDGLDVIMSSRATHHLSPSELDVFYRQAWEKLAPGGWVVNLDHTDLGAPWDARLKGARRALIPPSATPAEHPHVHTRPRPSVEEHLAGLRRAGFSDPATPWRGFQTCLLMARRDD